MRRISRINGSIDILRSRATAQTPSPYLCLVCKHQATSFSTYSIRTAAKVPFTEKIRQRIWGTDQPPGLKDPYGDRSRFDQTKMRVQDTEIEERKVAATPDLSNYEPATTWDGLERVGGFGHWWKENWDPDHQFAGFLPTEVMTGPDEITAALHRAMVEVFALQQAGRSLGDISKAVLGADMTLDVQISPSANGAALQFSNETSLEDVVQSLAFSVDETAEKGAPTESEEDVAADRSSVDPIHPEATSSIDETSEKGNPTESEEDVAADRSTQDPLPSALAQMLSYDELIASWGPQWLQVSFDNPEVKFAVLKRTMQLTGIRVPDSAIMSARNAQALLKQLIVPPKPRKLVEALEQKEDLINLPNVSVYAKRVTPIDKERSVGRWKIIEQELQERGLPVTGH